MIKTSDGISNVNSDALEMLSEVLRCSKDEILFIDIETTGLSPRDSEIYMIGAAYYSQGAWRISQFFADTQDQEKEVLIQFSAFSKNYKKLVHFNGDRFDIPFLQKRYEEYGLQDPFVGMESYDIYKQIKPYKLQLGLPDCKQQTIEQFMGIKRDDDSDGGRLIAVYKEYEESRDSELLKLLLLHNFDNVTGLLKLVPMLYYEHFFNMFRNMPKVSISTDEEIDEEKFMQSITLEDGSKGKAIFPVRAIKVQANQYRDVEGKEKKEVYMKLCLPLELPSPIMRNTEGCYFKAVGKEAVLRVPLVEDELKYFYSNYKDYYYLPMEDVAIHKSLATFVDKQYRVKAKPENCYTRKVGQYLKEWDLVFTPFFKEDYEDKSFYFDLNQIMKKSRFGMSLYATHVIAHILDL
ncbi:MAG: ribonuclease H-like domain-containing protein [Butyrivibrio sp.]|nr:ribonuclease H-like domain-containing protein [Butyrivibrio sp.]